MPAFAFRQMFFFARQALQRLPAMRCFDFPCAAARFRRLRYAIFEFISMIISSIFSFR
jgi:hypothetical protein